MKRLLLLAAEFLIITVPLGYLWVEGFRTSYLQFFARLSKPVLLLIGVRDIYGEYILDHFINFVPFLVLMVITPALGWKRRIVGTLIGLVVLFIGHICLTATAFYAISNHGQTQTAFSILFPGYLINDSLPFVIWAIVASEWLKGIVSVLRTDRKSGRS